MLSLLAPMLPSRSDDAPWSIKSSELALLGADAVDTGDERGRLRAREATEGDEAGDRDSGLFDPGSI